MELHFPPHHPQQLEEEEEEEATPSLPLFHSETMAYLLVLHQAYFLSSPCQAWLEMQLPELHNSRECSQTQLSTWAKHLLQCLALPQAIQSGGFESPWSSSKPLQVNDVKLQQEWFSWVPKTVAIPARVSQWFQPHSGTSDWRSLCHRHCHLLSRSSHSPLQKSHNPLWPPRCLLAAQEHGTSWILHSISPAPWCPQACWKSRAQASLGVHRNGLLLVLASRKLTSGNSCRGLSQQPAQYAWKGRERKRRREGKESKQNHTTTQADTAACWWDRHRTLLRLPCQQ